MVDELRVQALLRLTSLIACKCSPQRDATEVDLPDCMQVLTTA